MIVEPVKTEEGVREYLELCRKEFPSEIHDPPAIVFRCSEDGVLVGYAAGYFMGTGVFYMQRLWFAGEYKHKGLSRKYGEQLWSYLSAVGVVEVRARVISSNQPALIAMLKNDWFITGIDTSFPDRGLVYVLLIKTLY